MSGRAAPSAALGAHSPNQRAIDAFAAHSSPARKRRREQRDARRDHTRDPDADKALLDDARVVTVGRAATRSPKVGAHIQARHVRATLQYARDQCRGHRRAKPHGQAASSVPLVSCAALVLAGWRS